MLTFVLLFQSIVIGQTPRPEGSTLSDPRCGAYCLQIALKSFNIGPRSFADLEKALGPPETGGYSIAALSEVARSSGAHTLAVETSLENLLARARPFACIALVSPTHFVLIQDADDRSVQIVDPPRSYELPLETFKLLWTNKALLVSPDPLAPEESIREAWRLDGRSALAAVGASALVLMTLFALSRYRRSRVAVLVVAASGWIGCGPAPTPDQVVAQGVAAETEPRSAILRVEPAEHRLGDLPKVTVDSTAETKTVLRNLGQAPLRITALRTSCACTMASVDRESLAPGESTTLTARIAIGDSPEARNATIVVVSNDPQSPETTVSFEWRASNPLRVQPPVVHWARLTPNTSHSIDLTVTARGLGNLEGGELSVTASSKDIRTRLIPGPPKASGPVNVADVSLGVLHLDIESGPEPGEARHHVLLTLSRGKEQLGRLTVPVSWSVQPSFRATPDRFFLGIIKPGSTLERKAVLSHTDSTAFRIMKVSCSEPSVLLQTEAQSPLMANHVLSLSLKCPDREGPWRAMITIETDIPDARPLEIPVSAVLNP